MLKVLCNFKIAINSIVQRTLHFKTSVFCAELHRGYADHQTSPDMAPKRINIGMPATVLGSLATG